jgi:hypothetical protein
VAAVAAAAAVVVLAAVAEAQAAAMEGEWGTVVPTLQGWRMAVVRV